MKLKTDNLMHVALDWAVAEASRQDYPWMKTYLSKSGRLMTANYGEFDPRKGVPFYQPSQNWNEGGYIIEREKIGFWFVHECVDEDGKIERAEQWYAEYAYTEETADSTYHFSTGPTPLIAAMRCYVLCKLGEEVTLPDDIAKAQGVIERRFAKLAKKYGRVLDKDGRWVE